jgi:hypothetical protein
MTRNRLYILVAVVAAILIAILAFNFVSSQPSVPDGGGEDTNVGDMPAGSPDGGSGPGG